MDAFSLALLGVLAFVIFLIWVGAYNNKLIRESREEYAKSLSSSDQITFHYSNADSAPTVTRQTVQRLGEQLGMDETRVIHQALFELASRNAVLQSQA